jgi:ferredoxin
MSKRKIIEIDRAKCNGCGLCTTACAEGALVLDKEKKAVLAKEIYCDGLGACLDVCPTGALRIVERDSKEYDPKAAFAHVKKIRGKEAALKVHDGQDTADHKTTPLPCGCPGSVAQEIKQKKMPGNAPTARIASELTQWPIQLHLISPQAPYFQGCDLLIAADCTAFSLGSFHQDLLKGKKLVIACPKLDETDTYVEKLAELLKNATIYSLTVAIMSVPCCSGLYAIAQKAVEFTGKSIAIKKIVIGLDGTVAGK